MVFKCVCKLWPMKNRILILRFEFGAFLKHDFEMSDSRMFEKHWSLRCCFACIRILKSMKQVIFIVYPTLAPSRVLVEYHMVM